MANYHLKDNRLSLKAQGILSKVLSLPENWDFSLAGMVKICKDGRDSIRSGLNELEEYGYLKRERARDGKGKLSGAVWNWHEKPTFKNPTSENPTYENPLQLSTKGINELKEVRGETPTPSNFGLINIHTFRGNAVAGVYYQWVEAQRRNNKLNQEQFFNLLDNFVKHCESQGKDAATKQDYMSYFDNLRRNGRLKTKKRRVAL